MKIYKQSAFNNKHVYTFFTKKFPKLLTQGKVIIMVRHRNKGEEHRSVIYNP